MIIKRNTIVNSEDGKIQYKCLSSELKLYFSDSKNDYYFNFRGKKYYLSDFYMCGGFWCPVVYDFIYNDEKCYFTGLGGSNPYCALLVYIPFDGVETIQVFKEVNND